MTTFIADNGKTITRFVAASTAEAVRRATMIATRSQRPVNLSQVFCGRTIRVRHNIRPLEVR